MPTAFGHYRGGWGRAQVRLSGGGGGGGGGGTAIGLGMAAG